MTSRLLSSVILSVALAWITGCGETPPPAPRETQPAGGDSVADRAAADFGQRPSRVLQNEPPDATTSQPSRADSQSASTPAVPHAKPRSLADLLSQVGDSASRLMPEVPRVVVDDARAAALGIRKLSGKHVDLYTDFSPRPAIDELPEVFDQAFDQWCAYFGIDPTDHADWRLTGFVIHEPGRFKQAGLLPDDLPPFQHAYARNYEFWVYDQPSDYYRRHLVLHEGTHGFMNTLFGACGPPWYMEGIAELLATHRWHDGRLELNYVPGDKGETPMWGRVKIIKDAVAAGRAWTLDDVLDVDGRAFVETEPYGWCWAAALLLDRHPRYQNRFRQLYHDVLRADFTARFRQALSEDWADLADEWDLFVANLEYGHDVARCVVDFTRGRPLPDDGATIEIAADRGWQNSGFRLDAGRTYHIEAQGRYQVADQPQIWWCEPGGVTMRYYQGRPLGVLLAAVRGDTTGLVQKDTAGQAGSGTHPPNSLLQPVVVGLAAVITPEISGTLYLKINDSPGELGDNAGVIQVRITRP